MERSTEIAAELQGIAPALAELGIPGQPYRIPIGYFDQFYNSLIEKIQLGAEEPDNEIRALSPLLAGLERKSPYNVPAGYFDELSVPTPVPSRQKAPVFSLRRVRPVLRYAVAAMLTGVIATAAFFFFHKSSNDPLSALNAISDQEMANYLENHDVHWVPGTSSTPTASVSYDDNDISDLLSNVSDDELEAYQPVLSQNQRTVN